MNDLQNDLEALKAKLHNPEPMLRAIGQRAMLPYFGRRLTTVGVKDRTGRLRAAISQENAPGNVFDLQGDSITVGVDYDQVPYARYVIEGADAHPITARRVPFLIFWWVKMGRMFKGKRVNHPEQRRHPVYNATTGLDTEVGKVIIQELRPTP